jgi:hypothetical protein
MSSECGLFIRNATGPLALGEKRHFLSRDPPIGFGEFAGMNFVGAGCPSSRPGKSKMLDFARGRGR